jgi:hypothetical protein
MEFPSLKYAHIPTTTLHINDLKINMHHEVLAPILPEDGKNWFRRVVSHRYSFALPSLSALDTKQERQDFQFLKNTSNAIQFLWNKMLTTTSPTQLSKEIYFNWFNRKFRVCLLRQGVEHQ